MTPLTPAQLLPRGLRAGATSALGHSTSGISQLRVPAPPYLPLAFGPTPPRSTTWPGSAQLPFEDLREYFIHSPNPVP